MHMAKQHILLTAMSQTTDDFDKEEHMIEKN